MGKSNTKNVNLFRKHKTVWARNISDKFTSVSEIHGRGRSTRSATNCDLYVPPDRHTEVYKQSFVYSDAIA